MGDDYGPVFICKGSFVEDITKGLYQDCSYYNQRELPFHRRAFKRDIRKAVNRDNL